MSAYRSPQIAIMDCPVHGRYLEFMANTPASEKRDNLVRRHEDFVSALPVSEDLTFRQFRILYRATKAGAEDPRINLSESHQPK